MVPGPDRAAGGTALADPYQEGPAISAERLETGVEEPSCMAASGISEEMSARHSRVLDTLVKARAPAMRHLYALKWGVFVKWCSDVHIDPATCSVSDVLRFLQHRLDSAGVGNPWLFHPSVVTPCSVGVQSVGEVSPDF